MAQGNLRAAGLIALVTGHCAGMLDLVALPVWVGALVERYGFSPRDAGMLATLFLIGGVAASLAIAPRFNRLRPKLVAVGGFGTAALIFTYAASQTAFVPLAIAHLASGVASGAALSVVHGTIGRTANPHRTFAFAGIAIGIFGVILMGMLPQILIARGGGAMFLAFAALMALATMITFIGFPPASALTEAPSAEHSAGSLSRGVWYVILGISVMMLNQSIIFSFVEVIGKARGFPPGHVLAVLAALAVVNCVVVAPASIALERRIRAEDVVRLGPTVQAAFALVVTGATAFSFWAPFALVFVGVQIFTHTFAFGLLARMDRSGRATAATPAMLMSGSALGPILGGTLAQSFGFAALGYAGVLIAMISTGFFIAGCAPRKTERTYA
ncbi:MFS transporter (plasmid) [Roseomonas mucosa]|uniref:MFS transporter n=1 Tax=Roseomonas mucosa TaxID=207340 RepID=UPI0030CF5862